MFSKLIVTRNEPNFGKNSLNIQKKCSELPKFVKNSRAAMRYYDLLHPLKWEHFPERDLKRNYGCEVLPFSNYALACLVKINEGIRSMGQLQEYLRANIALSWLLGFNLLSDFPIHLAANFKKVIIPLPTERHFTRLLRIIPNAVFQTMLDSTVKSLQTELANRKFGKVISLDTKLIIAWVKENNAKVSFKEGRFDKNKQPRGDLDCRLGCKRRHNQRINSKESQGTPNVNPKPAQRTSVGEYYWGYGSGVVATKIPDWGEFVLAEFTQPFDHSDVSYFFPLMAETERRLGFCPQFGALDAAFDASYVYEYFDQAGGFAAVPLVERGGYKKRSFNQDGLPLCEAGLPMPLKGTYMDRTHLFERRMGRHKCSLLKTEEACPIEHKNWQKGSGCTTTLAVGPGARVRHTLDRESEAYKEIYKQRTATERINSQAKALGIERPNLRNGKAISNLNTLIYVLINLKALLRVRKKKTG